MRIKTRLIFAVAVASPMFAGSGCSNSVVVSPPPVKKVGAPTTYAGTWSHIVVRGHDRGSFVVDSLGNFSADSVTRGHMSDSGFTGVILSAPGGGFSGGCPSFSFCVAPIRGATQVTATR